MQTTFQRKGNDYKTALVHAFINSLFFDKR